VTGKRSHGTLRQLLPWLLVYVVLAAVPLLLLFVPPRPPPRALSVELGVALGFIALALLGLQFVLTGRFGRVATSLGLDTMLQFHRQAGIVASVLVLGHVAVLLVAYPPYRSFLDPRVDFVRAAALWVLLGTLALLLVLTFARRPLGLRYEWWRALHALLAATVLLIGTVHVIRVGWYSAALWRQIVWVAATLVALALLAQVRVLKPVQSRRRPYRVVDVRSELGDAWTLSLEPVGHAGTRLQAGQFFWLSFGQSPMSLQQHPFSISSSADAAPKIELTIKALGDFTGGIGRTPIGTTAYIEGPYGAFTLRDDADAFVMIAGGVGITPMMSMLRTMRDREDRRPVTLIYATRSVEQSIFHDELAPLERELQLRLVRIYEQPPAEGTGERGVCDSAALQRLLPHDSEGTRYYVCGPPIMMDEVELTLLASGVAMHRIHSERFDIA
jgi:predicted ferric reductase